MSRMLARLGYEIGPGSRIGEIAARTMIGASFAGALITAAHAALPGELPSAAHNRAVTACAKRLSDEEQVVASYDVPGACRVYDRTALSQSTYADGTEVNGLYVNISSVVLPSAAQFETANLVVGDSYDQQVQQDGFEESARLLALGGGVCGLLILRRRLPGAGVVAEATAIAMQAAPKE